MREPSFHIVVPSDGAQERALGCVGRVLAARRLRQLLLLSAHHEHVVVSDLVEVVLQQTNLINSRILVGAVVSEDG